MPHTIRRILVLEDDEVYRLHVKRLLRDRAFMVDVVECQTLAEARRALNRDEFDVGIFDFHLPDGTVLDLLGHLDTQAGGRLPVVVVTAGDDTGHASAALAAGAQDYLVKGTFDLDGLERAMRFAIERKRTESLHRQLQHSERLASLGQLAAGLAHEINNPNTFVYANLQAEREYLERLRAFLEDDLPGLPALANCGDAVAAAIEEAGLPEVLDTLDEMAAESLEGIERVSRIVKDLRVLASPNDGPRSEVDVDSVIARSIRVTAHAFRHRATLRHTPAGLPPIEANGDQLLQVLVNVLLNAGQAFERDDVDANVVDVSARAHAQGVAIEVHDNGPGIPASMRSRIFDPFFTTKAPGEGTGLGLAISRQLAEAHGGTLEAVAPDEGGTLIRLWLPRPARPEDDDAHQMSEATDVEQRTRVLLIDDEPLVLKACSRLLRRDYDVLTATDAPTALELVAANPRLDAVVCDLMLPGIDGAGFYERLADLRPELLDAVVFITGGVSRESLRVFVDGVSNPVLFKPVDSAELLDVVARTARQSSSVRT